MAGFPLMALGAGIGQGAQQIQQQDESALRQQMARQALMQYQREQQAKALLTQAFGLGGSMPGFGNQGGGGLNLPGTQMQPQQMQMPQQAPPPMAAPPPPVPPMAAAPPASAGRTLTPELQDMMETSPTELRPEQAEALYRAAGAAESRAGVPLTPAPAAPAAGAPPIGPDGLQKGYTDEAYNQKFGGGGTGAGLPAEPPAAAPSPAMEPVQTHDEMSQYLGMFQRTDPSAWVKRIREARPDAPDDVVWDAVERLNKMSSGNIREQLAAASMIKFLKGEEGKNARFAQTMPLKQEALADKRENTDLRRQTQQRLSSQFQERTKQFNSRLAQAKSAASATDRRAQLNSLLRDIDQQLRPVFGQPAPSDEEKAGFMRQRDDIVNELRKGAGMKPLESAAPAPAPAPSE